MKKTVIVSSIRINSGSGFRMLAIAKYLSRNGKDILLTGMGYPAGGRDGFGYTRIPEIPWVPLAAFAALVVNSAVLFRYRPSKMIVSKPLPPSFLPALLCRWINGGCLILDFDDVEHDYWRENPLYRKVLRWTERYAVVRADIITIHSAELRKYLVENYGISDQKVMFLPQGIDTELFPVENRDDALVRDLGLQGKKIIVYAAHFTVAVKDFEFVLQMMKCLSASENDAVLLVIGDGPGLAQYRKRVRELDLEKYVRFAGYVSHGEIGRYFAAGHIAVNYLGDTPANVCRASIKLREYLLAGLRVVCNDVSDDVRQFAPFIKTFSTGDIPAFCERVKEALEESTTRNNNAAEYIRENYSWKAVIAGFLKEFEKRGNA